MRNGKANGARLSGGAATGAKSAAGMKKTVAPPERNVCVYCGSGKGRNSKYAQAAKSLGKALAASGIGLVYGGGGLGLMGETAKAVLGAGGSVTGIIPHFLSEREHMLQDVNEIIVTADMHERKRLMFERSDAFVALPGGIGTLEELVEQLTWSQLGQHAKPIVLVDVNGFWKPFLTLIQHMRDEAFIRPGLDVRLRVVGDAGEVVRTVRELAPTAAPTAAAARIPERF